MSRDATLPFWPQVPCLVLEETLLMHMYLLHYIVLVPGWPWSLWALGGLGILSPFYATGRQRLGAQADRFTQKTPEIGRTGGLNQNAVGPNGL